MRPRRPWQCVCVNKGWQGSLFATLAPWLQVEGHTICFNIQSKVKTPKWICATAELEFSSEDFRLQAWIQWRGEAGYVGMGEDTKDWRNNNTMADGAAAAKLWQRVPTRGHSVGKTQKHIREQQANKQARRDGDRKDREGDQLHRTMQAGDKTYTQSHIHRSGRGAFKRNVTFLLNNQGGRKILLSGFFC